MRKLPAKAELTLWNAIGMVASKKKYATVQDAAKAYLAVARRGVTGQISIPNSYEEDHRLKYPLYYSDLDSTGDNMLIRLNNPKEARDIIRHYTTNVYTKAGWARKGAGLKPAGLNYRKRKQKVNL